MLICKNEKTRNSQERKGCLIGLCLFNFRAAGFKGDLDSNLWFLLPSTRADLMDWRLESGSSGMNILTHAPGSALAG
jgi:hypothetical protein